MKVTHSFNIEGELLVTLTAETTQDCARLAWLGQNADAPTREVTSVFAERETLTAYVNLRTIRVNKRTGRIGPE